MNTQYLQFVHKQLIVATTDLSGATRDQLVVFAENAMFEVTSRSQSRLKVVNPVSGRLMNPTSPPIPGQQSCAKGSSITLVQPVEYSTASWRRAVLSLDEHQKAWLLWNYSENVRWENQVSITQWTWTEFKASLGTREVAGKTLDRLKSLIWLAAQDMKAELAGRETYEYQQLAQLVEAVKATWTEAYLPYWLEMKQAFERLDNQALLSVSRSRSQQKTTSLEVSKWKLLNKASLRRV